MPSRETFGLIGDGAPLLLYLVFAPFAAVFCYGLYRRLRGLHLKQLLAAGPGGAAGALRRFCAYALLQRRVAQRPRGWPHLGIFYGFVALLIGTTLVALDWDVWRPLGGRILQGSTYLYVEAMLDLLGVVFVFSLAVALVWRLLKLAAADAGQRRIQAEFVALLVALLYMGLTGFILEGLRLSLEPVPWAGWSFVGQPVARLITWFDPGEAGRTVYAVLWWSHALVAFALIAALPYSTFLHALGGPLNVMAHPGRPQIALDAPFDLRELQASGDFDVKVGAAGLADFSDGERLALLACTNCGRCDSVCPAFAAGTALAPRRLVQTLRWRRLAGNDTADLLADGAVSPEEVWACTTCAACVEACPVFIRPVDYIVPFRRELVTRQQTDKRQAELLDKLGRSFNPYGLPPANRTRLVQDLAQGSA